MRVLVFTVTAGEGHNAIAKAVCEELESRGIETRLVDLYKGRKKLLAWIMNKGYFTLLRYFLTPTNYIFRREQQRSIKRRNSSIVRIVADWEKSYVKEQIDEFRPDAVFCSHFIPGAAIINLKKEFELPPTAVMMTDYCVYPYCENTTGCEYFLIPTMELKERVAARGVAEERILAFGIPVKEKFARQLDKAEMLRKIGLDPAKRTVLVMNGGIGFGRIDRLIRDISKIEADYQIINVCGRNEKMRLRVEKLIKKGRTKPIVNLGYVDNVDELMSAADLYIGKVGMISINEAMNKELPMIALNRLAQQEIENRAFMTERRAMIQVQNLKELPGTLSGLLEHPEQIEELKANIRKIRKPDAKRELGDFLERIAGDYHAGHRDDYHPFGAEKLQ